VGKPTQFVKRRVTSVRIDTGMTWQKGACVTSRQSTVRIVDKLARLIGNRPLRADELFLRAQKATGLEDFGEISLDEPLSRFLEACSSEAALSLFGRLATKWDIVRFLSNLLRFRAEEKLDSDILNQHIDCPIFITGLPRSGTTFLHRLLMADPANRAPLVWETIFPYPRPNQGERRVAHVARQLRAFEFLAPEFRSLHPLDATSPQECSEITAHVFRSLRFDTTYHLPSYRHWLDADASRLLPAYQFHKRFLRHMQHQDRKRLSVPARSRWVLKCPEHVFALDAIRAVYPDARIVFVHRDPLKVLLSVAKLTEVLRRPFTLKVDPLSIGREESARWLDGTRRMRKAQVTAGFQEAVCHVHHLDLIADPVGTVRRMYRHFGLELSKAAVTSIQGYTAKRPNGGYGPRHYSFERHGLHAMTEREKFQPYMTEFGIRAEHSSWERMANVPG
jgi:hypothetical protein